MVYEWGRHKTSGDTSYIYSGDETTTLKPGLVYESIHSAYGIGTMVPGWEPSAVNDITASLAQHGCVPTYFKADDTNDTVTVQFKYTGTETTAMVAPIVWAVVFALIVFGIIVYLDLRAPTMIKAMQESLIDNPLVTYAIYGVLAILLLQQITNWRSSRYDDE